MKCKGISVTPCWYHTARDLKNGEENKKPELVKDFRDKVRDLHHFYPDIFKKNINFQCSFLSTHIH